jgi:hypothetical protein
MDHTRALRRRQLWTTVLLPILLVLPFTGPYEHYAGLLAQCLYVGAVLLAVAATGLLLAPVAHTVVRRCASETEGCISALLSSGSAISQGATALTALLLVDLALSGLVGSPLTG